MLAAWWRRLWGRDVSFGRRGEDVAARHLQSLGYRILERGRRSRLGELDLVALDDKTVVFVEVKTRQSASHGQPSEAVNVEKQKRLTRTALGYLKRHRLLNQRARFDVVSIVWPTADGEPQVTHIRSAFAARGPSGMFS